MYSDYEIDCLYLGKPFEERNIHSEDAGKAYEVSEVDIDKVRVALPLLNRLVDAACVAVKYAV